MGDSGKHLGQIKHGEQSGDNRSLPDSNYTSDKNSPLLPSDGSVSGSTDTIGSQIVQYQIKLVDYLQAQFDHLLLDNTMWGKITKNQQSIMDTLTEMKGILMDYKQMLTDFSGKVDELTNAESASIEAIKAEIADLSSRIANISPAEAQAILDGATAKMQTVADTLKAVAAGGGTSVPPPSDTQPPL